MAAFNLFDAFSRDLARGVHDFRAAGGTFRVYLTNAVPSAAADAVKADLAEIATGSGYTGAVDIVNDESISGATMSLTGTDVTVTASGGTVGPFRYVALYNDTPTSPADPLVGWWDHGSEVTLSDGDSFTVDFGATILDVA